MCWSHVSALFNNTPIAIRINYKPSVGQIFASVMSSRRLLGARLIFALCHAACWNENPLDVRMSFLVAQKHFFNFQHSSTFFLLTGTHPLHALWNLRAKENFWNKCSSATHSPAQSSDLSENCLWIQTSSGTDWDRLNATLSVVDAEAAAIRAINSIWFRFQF